MVSIAESFGDNTVITLCHFIVPSFPGLAPAFLFAPPRPLRPEGASATAGLSPNRPQETNGTGKTVSLDSPAIDSPRATGNAALARRVGGPG